MNEWMNGWMNGVIGQNIMQKGYTGRGQPESWDGIFWMKHDPNAGSIAQSDDLQSSMQIQC